MSRLRDRMRHALGNGLRSGCGAPPTPTQRINPGCVSRFLARGLARSRCTRSRPPSATNQAQRSFGRGSRVEPIPALRRHRENGDRGRVDCRCGPSRPIQASGIGQTTRALLADAGRRALLDAGLRPSDVDGLGVASFTLAPDHAIDLAFRLGLRVRWLMDAATGGASAVDMLQHARRAVEAGDARCVLLLAGDRLDADDFVRLVDEYNTATRDHLAPIPTGGPNALFALLTQPHGDTA